MKYTTLEKQLEPAVAENCTNTYCTIIAEWDKQKQQPPQSPLPVACYYCHFAIARQLILQGAGINTNNPLKQGETPLHIIVETIIGQLKKKQGISPETLGFMNFLSQQDIALVPDHKNRTPFDTYKKFKRKLDSLSMQDQKDYNTLYALLECLPERKPKADIFRIAIYDQSSDLPQILKNTDVNITDLFDKSPLMYAAEHGSITTLKHLLKNGADPNLVTGDGHEQSALLFALERKEPAIVKILLDHGAGCNALFDGLSPLGIAVLNYHPKSGTVNDILKKNLKPSEETKEKLRILGAYDGEIIQLLLKHGANPKQSMEDSDYCGWTPLQIAKEEIQDLQLVQMLEEAQL